MSLSTKIVKNIVGRGAYGRTDITSRIISNTVPENVQIVKKSDLRGRQVVFPIRIKVEK